MVIERLERIFLSLLFSQNYAIMVKSITDSKTVVIRTTIAAQKRSIMIKRVLLEGTPDEKIMTCLRAAGWYEGRSVDLTEVKAFYASGSIVLPAGAENFLREYYGLAGHWFFNEPNDEIISRRGPDIEFRLYSMHTVLDKQYFDPAFSSEDAEDLKTVEAVSGEPVVYVGNIGYYYSAAIYLGTSHKIYTTHDYDDIVHCYDSVPEMLRYDFYHADEWNSVSMSI